MIVVVENDLKMTKHWVFNTAKFDQVKLEPSLLAVVDRRIAVFYGL